MSEDNPIQKLHNLAETLGGIFKPYPKVGEHPIGYILVHTGNSEGPYDYDGIVNTLAPEFEAGDLQVESDCWSLDIDWAQITIPSDIDAAGFTNSTESPDEYYHQTALVSNTNYPPLSLRFYNAGNVVGKLTWDESKQAFDFQGGLTESAEKFMEVLTNVFRGELNTIAQKNLEKEISDFEVAIADAATSALDNSNTTYPTKRIYPIMQHFTYEHLPDYLQVASRPFCELADYVDRHLPDNPEKSVTLRKLLEAKDAAVRARISGEG